MKTAISLPDNLFEMAEAEASRLRMTRSELYARALSEFLERNEDDEITRKLNEVYAGEVEGLDPAFRRAQAASIGEESW